MPLCICLKMSKRSRKLFTSNLMLDGWTYECEHVNNKFSKKHWGLADPRYQAMQCEGWPLRAHGLFTAVGSSGGVLVVAQIGQITAMRQPRPALSPPSQPPA